MTESQKISEQLQRAIAESCHSLYRIAKDTDVPYATVWRFMNDKQDLRLETVDKLANYLNLSLTWTFTPKPKLRQPALPFKPATKKPRPKKS